MGHKEEQLFTALAAAAKRRMREFNSQDLAKTAWAYSTACMLDEDLQLHVTRSAFALSRKLDGQGGPFSHKSAVFAIFTGVVAVSGCKYDQHILESELPGILAEGPHWFALYKPPFWKLSDESQKAVQACDARCTVLGGEEDADVEETCHK